MDPMSRLSGAGVGMLVGKAGRVGPSLTTRTSVYLGPRRDTTRTKWRYPWSCPTRSGRDGRWSNRWVSRRSGDPIFRWRVSHLRGSRGRCRRQWCTPSWTFSIPHSVTTLPGLCLPESDCGGSLPRVWTPEGSVVEWDFNLYPRCFNPRDGRRDVHREGVIKDPRVQEEGRERPRMRSERESGYIKGP